MVRNRRIALTLLGAMLLSAPAHGADLFPTPARRQAFLQALQQQDESYDPNEKMLQAAFSSPGYHTTLTAGTVHRTRSSLEYAVALLDSDEPERQKRAEQILRRVIALQDQDPASRTYGIWSWFLEEPLEQMAPPDWNWADFCGTQLLQVAIDHVNRLPGDLQQQVKGAILHAARSIQRRNVGPGYTNIALMGTYVTLVAGERFGVTELRDYGRQRLRRFYEYTADKGSFSEYNSPTYTLVAIEEISRMRRHVRDIESRALLRRLNEFAWQHVACRFHPPTKQWAGPHSRSYATLLRPGALAFVQRATAEKIDFLPEAEAWKSIRAQRIGLECPNDLHRYFTELTAPREEIETFIRNARDEHDIIGTTYLHPAFTLGSVNVGDLWNQRRPLIAYWATPSGPAAVRLRCLHDDYDYASASLFAIQDDADCLAAVLFATDRGDTHISLDRIKNATIRAQDLRVRLEFEGALGDLVIPAKAELDEPVSFTSGSVAGTFCIHGAALDDLPVTMETGRSADAAWIDLVLYRGVEREFNFAAIEEAAIVFTLAIASRKPSIVSSTSPRALTVHVRTAGTIVAGVAAPIPRETWSWQRPNRPYITLTIPTRPLPTKDQKNTTQAKLASENPWKASH